MTKDQFIALIESNFNTGQLSFITGDKVYNSFFQICDMVFGNGGTGRYRGVCNAGTNPGVSQYGDYFIATYNSTNLQTFTNFGLTAQIGELCIFRYTTLWSKSIIGTITGSGSTGAMTASEIRDALETLTAFDRLSKSSILHGEGGLNYMGKDNFSTMVYADNVYKGDLFIHHGTSASYVNGDWAIALADGLDASTIATDPLWLVVPFGKWAAAFSADVNGNVTFEKNVIVKGQAYSQEHTITITPTEALYEEYTPNFDNSNVIRITSQYNLMIANPSNKKNGSTFLIIIRASAAIEIIFDTDFVELSTLSLQTDQTVIISGVVSNGQILCDQSKIFGATAVTNPPVLDSIVINNSDAETASRTVSVTPTFSGGGVPAKYAIKEEGGSYGQWITYEGSFSHEIQSLYEGTKTLYVKFANSLNEESEAKSDSILLIENVPSLTAISINNGSATTSVRNVMVYLQGISGLGTKQIRLSDDGTTWGNWAAISNPVNHTLTETNGEKTVYLQIKNIAGTQASTYYDTITLSTLGLPDLLSIEINEGDTETNDRDVSIALTIGNGTAPTHYAIQENGGAFGEWIAYTSSPVSHSIAHSGDGAKTIGVKMKDVSAIESETQSANILLVTDAATLQSISVNNGESSTISKSVQVSFNNVTGFGQKEVAVSESELSLSTFTPHNVNLPFPYTLSTGNGLKNIYAKVKNIAGESAAASDGILLDEPTTVTLSSFTLNSGNTATNQTVPFIFTASGNPDKYMISENNAFTGATWQNITGSETFTLSRGNGSKIVYLKVKRSSDNVESSPIQATITMTIATPTVAIASITGTAPNITINTSASNAYKMKVLELNVGAIPTWGSVAEEDYNSAKTFTLTGTGNRMLHVQVISYGDQTATDGELFEITLSVLNTFKVCFGKTNEDEIGTTDFYGFPKSTLNTPVELKNTSGATIGLSGSKISMEIDEFTGSIAKSTNLPMFDASFTDFPSDDASSHLNNTVYSKLHVANPSGTAPGYIILRLFNLNTAHKFDLKLVTTTKQPTSNLHHPLVFEVTGIGAMQSGTLTTVHNNVSDIVTFNDIVPNASGEIFIKLYVNIPSPYSSWTYSAINAAIIEQKG